MSARPSSNKPAATNPAPQAPGAAVEHVLEHRRVQAAQAHVKAFHGQITAGDPLQLPQITGGVKLFQLGQGRLARRDFDAPIAAEQAETISDAGA